MGPSPQSRTARWIVPVAIVIVWVDQILIDSLGRFLSWDEAVYFSQVATDHVAADFAVQRSRVVAWVAWPIGAVTDSVAVLRIYLLVLVSGAYVWVSRSLRPLGLGPQVGLAVFMIGATPVFHAGELSPNLWVGLAMLIIVTLVVFPRDRRIVDLISLLVWSGLVVWARPPDGAVFLTGLAIVMLSRRRLRDVKRISAMTVGGAIGLSAWLVDAISRYGTVAAVTDDIPNQITTGVGFRLRAFADMLDGPLRGAVLDGVSLLGILPWVVLLALGAVGIVTSRTSLVSRSSESIDTLWICGICGALGGVQYLVLTVSRSIRYIYPSWMLLAVFAGVLASRRSLSRVQAGTWVVVLALAVAQFFVLSPIASDQSAQRNPMVAVGEVLVDLSADQPCAAATEFGAPQIGFVSNCATSILGDVDVSLMWLEAKASEGFATFVVVFNEPSEGIAGLGPFLRLDIEDGRYWSVVQLADPQ